MQAMTFHVLENHADSLPELFNVSEVDFLEVHTSDPDYIANLSVDQSASAQMRPLLAPRP